MKVEKSFSEQLRIIEAGHPPPADAGVFGLTVTAQEAGLVLLGVPWDATASYRKGTNAAPLAFTAASHQLDLIDADFGEPYKNGICFLEELPRLPFVEEGTSASVINEASKLVNKRVYEEAQNYLRQGKFVAVVGGDHSCPFGLLQALAERQSFGILHIDAHHDLRQAYEGYEYSHASIMYNAIEKIPAISRLLSIGIRDYSKDEMVYAKANPKIETVYDQDFQRIKMTEPAASAGFLRDKLRELPEFVYLSFDIDGLDPTLCPGTGTPVPGGLSFFEASFILAELVGLGKKIIGFDLCEVAPRADDGEWNMNVGARILYKLCGALFASQNKR